MKQVLVGDFNFPDIDWATFCGSSISNKFCDLYDLLFQLNLFIESTHNHSNTLDLVITSDEDIPHNITVHLHDYQPDHFTISSSVTL